MAPKKAKAKMSLNEFLGDTALGSWADEMDSLPTAPAMRTDEEKARANDRFGRRDDFSSRPDRASGPPREDLPLPTSPPYTAFIGNLSFDTTEEELEACFSSNKTKSIKIIKDRDDKPKGFGYIEFVELEGLKDALTKSGTNISGRTIRVSVAEPPKERTGFSGGGGFDDDTKFSGNWRREGPLASQQDSRDSSRRRFDGPPSGDHAPAGVSDEVSDWRSSRPSRPPEPEVPSFRKKGPGFAPPPGQPSPADKEESWSIGSKFRPTQPSRDEAPSPKFGSLSRRGDMGPPGPPTPSDEGDWRSSSRKPFGRNESSPNNSTPPTPQLSRRKLELLPRSTSGSASPTPLSSPKIASSPVHPSSRSNPFGAAKPVDVTQREKAVEERLEKDREVAKEKLSHSMSRTSSRNPAERPGVRTTSPPPPAQVAGSPPAPSSPKLNAAASATIRPLVSFASAAGAKRDVPPPSQEDNGRIQNETDRDVDSLAEQVTEVAV